MNNNVSRAADTADDSDTVDTVIRIGLVAYGVVHLLIGWLALQIAFSEKSKQASGTGALEYLAQQPLGGVLIWVVALGLVALVLWRLLEAWQAWRTEDGSDRVKGMLPQLFKGVLYGVLAFSALKIALGQSSSGGGGGTTDITSTLLQLPAGQLIVGAIGLAIVGYGGYYIYQGWTETYLEKLHGGSSNADVSKAYRLTGKAGYIAKGAAVAVIGGLFVYAAVTQDPDKSGGLDQALQEISQQPFGQLLLTLVALGIACYGLFAFARARHFER